MIAAALVFLLAGCDTSGSPEALEGRTVTVYSSPTCSCCARYVDYLEEKGIRVESVTRSRGELGRLKTKHGVPRRARSCHTALIGDYFVEGHVPLEAIDRLIEQEPDVAGISLPGMPRHSPGMGRSVGKTLRVISVDERGRTDTFSSVRY